MTQWCQAQILCRGSDGLHRADSAALGDEDLQSGGSGLHERIGPMAECAAHATRACQARPRFTRVPCPQRQAVAIGCDRRRRLAALHGVSGQLLVTDQCSAAFKNWFNWSISDPLPMPKAFCRWRLAKASLYSPVFLP